MVEQLVVDNRVFLLGLDGLYRLAIKRHERTELLDCARRVAAELQVCPANLPVEGYYSEAPELNEYFRIMRALQEIEGSRISEVAHMKEFKRLRDVTSASLYGRPENNGRLLPAARSPLSHALLETFPEWTAARLTSVAYEIALKTDDISLVGLAARIRDPVVLGALGESVVLYMDCVFGIAQMPKYVWEVDNDLLELAGRFIDTFNTLFNEELPRPGPEQAPLYWGAYKHNGILGRCVRLGSDDRVSPARHYHWGICRNAAGEFAVQEFWHSKVWPTWAYRRALGPDGHCPNFRDRSRPNDLFA
jgi:hypothetical protein